MALINMQKHNQGHDSMLKVGLTKVRATLKESFGFHVCRLKQLSHRVLISQGDFYWSEMQTVSRMM